MGWDMVAYMVASFASFSLYFFVAHMDTVARTEANIPTKFVDI